jgi:hypothetical protein
MTLSPRRTPFGSVNGTTDRTAEHFVALQTHYGNPRTHQPLALAYAAAEELLNWLGFINVVRAQDETVTMVK